jgi:FAD dependent oxidoreductase TIGR03364
LLGLAHALEARRRGLNVVLLDRNARATGASVRHSGHLFFSALEPGVALDAAPQARERWLDLARRAGTVADQGGTLIIARNRDELAVLEAAAAEPARHARLHSRKRVGRLAPIPVDDVVGALHARHDLRIGPRSAPAALARLLRSDPGAHVEWGAHVHEIEPGIVHAGSLRIRADAIVVCPGADHRALPTELRSREAEVALQETQMLRLVAPSRRRYRQTLATGLSLLAYPGFCADGAITQLRERLELETPELVERAVSPVATQLSDGDVIFGSTTTYTDRPSPYSRERLDELMLQQARALLGIRPSVRQRWTSTQVGIRGGSDEDFLTTRPMTGVRVVRALRSTAAAMCHWHAATVLDELLAGAAADTYITVRDTRSALDRAGGVRAHAHAFRADTAVCRRP